MQHGKRPATFDTFAAALLQRSIGFVAAVDWPVIESFMVKEVARPSAKSTK
jgi:hypothetical protein